MSNQLVLDFCGTIRAFQAIKTGKKTFKLIEIRGDNGGVSLYGHWRYRTAQQALAFAKFEYSRLFKR